MNKLKILSSINESHFQVSRDWLTISMLGKNFFGGGVKISADDILKYFFKPS